MEENKVDNTTELNNEEAREILLDNETKSVELNEENINKESVNENENSRNFKFATAIGRSVIDTIVVTAISYIIFLIVEGIMKSAGYQIVSIYRFAFFFILYIVTSILYSSVSLSSKSGKTVGEKFFK